jgi:hypothetical protein
LNSVQVRILTGPNAGARLRVDKPAVTFGRAPECDLTLDQGFVSREHGRITLTDKGWVLENQSPNGTVVGGKKVTRKPRPIESGQVVSIGEQDVFEVVSLSEPPDEAPAPPPPSQAPDESGKQPISGRMKLWIGIGVFWLIVGSLAMFLNITSSNDRSEDPITRLPSLTEAEIRDRVADQIRQTLPKQPPDSRLAREHATNALRAYNQRNTDPQGWITALQEYRKALSYTAGPRLKDIEDDKRYLEVQNHLIDEITERYRRAYNLLRNRSFTRADAEYRELLRIYHAPGTPLYEELQSQWNLVKAHLDR